MTDKPSTHFTKQNQKEMESRFQQLESKSKTITIWEKGKSVREKFSSMKFDKSQMALLLSFDETGISNYLNSKVLYAFNINGVNYFGQGELTPVANNNYKLICNGDLFKSERRENFRLLTYPHYESYIQIPATEEEYEKSNVVSFQTKMSETSLFKNFLKIVDDKDTSAKEGFTKFRVLDISVSGLAFQIGEIEKNYLEQQRVLKPVHIYFNEDILIPAIEIRYIVPLIRGNGSAYKVGVQFLDVDTTTDQRLGKLINSAMRSFESDFEDFLK